jgi:hypothetical protein
MLPELKLGPSLVRAAPTLGRRLARLWLVNGLAGPAESLRPFPEVETGLLHWSEVGLYPLGSIVVTPDTQMPLGGYAPQQFRLCPLQDGDGDGRIGVAIGQLPGVLTQDAEPSAIPELFGQKVRDPRRFGADSRPIGARLPTARGGPRR